EGFGFSDTAFRIFILMASRRLESDRFFTDDYRPEVYTRAGIDWVEANDMRSVLLRHFPTLAPALEGVKNPFAPWTRVAAATPALVGVKLETVGGFATVTTAVETAVPVGVVVRQRPSHEPVGTVAVTCVAHTGVQSVGVWAQAGRGRAGEVRR